MRSISRLCPSCPSAASGGKTTTWTFQPGVLSGGPFSGGLGLPLGTPLEGPGSQLEAGPSSINRLPNLAEPWQLPRVLGLPRASRALCFGPSSPCPARPPWAAARRDPAARRPSPHNVSGRRRRRPCDPAATHECKRKKTTDNPPTC